MKFSIILLGAALCLLSPTKAGITTNNPFNGVTWNGGETVKVVWDDDKVAPLLTDIGLTTVDLMVGGDSAQFLAKTIGQTQAFAKEIGFTVPKDVGPPGAFYFIKYTAGTYTSYSGTFSIENVDGKIAGFDPTNPNSPKLPPPPGVSAAAATPTPSNPTAAPTNDPKSNPNNATSPSSAAKSPLPSTLSGNAANLLPSFAGIATAAVALTFTYLF